MTPRLALVSAVAASVISLAILLEWVALPSTLGAAESKAVSATAVFRPGKGGHVAFTDSSGWQAQVHCGKVRPLCDLLKSRPSQVVEVRLIPVGLLDEHWASSAVVDGKDLLHLPDQEQAYARSRAIHLAMALVFLLAAALFGGFLHVATRAARSNGRGDVDVR